MEETPINIAYPSVEDLYLQIAHGACRFKGKPGEGDAWVAGTYHDLTDRRVTPLRRFEDRLETERHFTEQFESVLTQQR